MKIIAVAGGPATGKTYFAKYLQDRLNGACVLSLDQFYLDKPEKLSLSQFNRFVPTAFDFRHFHQALEDLKEGLPVHEPIYDSLIGKRKQSSHKIQAQEFVIIEGLYVLMHASLRSLLNYSFFLDTPPDAMLASFLKKEETRPNPTLENGLHQYFAYARPAYYTHIQPTRQFASMIVNTDFNGRLDLFIDDFLRKYTL